MARTGPRPARRLGGSAVEGTDERGQRRRLGPLEAGMGPAAPHHASVAGWQPH